MRNIMDAALKSLQPEIHARVRAILDALDAKTTMLFLSETLVAYETKASKAITIFENGFDDVIAVLALPEKCRKRLRSTNGIERLKEEVRRREQVIRIFPNWSSAPVFRFASDWFSADGN
ncbi:hypothetical protein TcarDRAFT_2717 [Thermosinus carboxydivorans Nor1]|uniref:Mutator family transposase n=1 Tax=Thermosinus carboxydivorans Nor1 TaxID=401526 RepID=A1HMJ0_9FIRM|nr:hypothetical protein TcarDRAFT_2717 [Thermosinus carboxydivorans Nor1]